MESKSWRHHYIQQFLIKGFLNERAKVFVFDKELNKIKTKEQSTKSIFFEKYKNTIFFENGKNLSIIEDLLYMNKDNSFSEIIKEFQNSKLPNESLLTTKKIAEFANYIIDLFWRIPYSDEISKRIIDNIVKKNNYEINEKDSFYKQYRSFLYQFTLKNPDKLKNKKNGFITKIFEIKNNFLILGDNPIIYEREPESFDDIFDLDYCIAISSNRIVMQSLKEVDFFSDSMVMDYNNLVIEQSNRFVCSGSKQILQSCIEYSKNVKDLDLEKEFTKNIFKK
jgi:hypothetical protein